jgi:prepilin-type N-terminal cleavage/methylation domain-containing protein
VELMDLAMKYPNKSRGFSVLELLLALTIAAGLLVLSYNRYQNYKHKLKAQVIQQDISLIFEALSYYYHAQTCSTTGGVPGTFPSVDIDLMPNLMISNFLVEKELMMPAPVLRYKALVVDSLQKNSLGKPLYHWQVIALLDPHANLSAYQDLLNAQAANPANSSLIWSLPANANPIRTSTPFWILNGNLMYFKNQQTFSGADGCN